MNLSNTTFIIPLRIESDDRLRNVIVSSIYLLDNTDCQIIVKESDKTSVFVPNEIYDGFGEDILGICFPTVNVPSVSIASPVAVIVPLTSNFVDGDVVPIPTLDSAPSIIKTV